jgi:hypothetical protein
MPLSIPKYIIFSYIIILSIVLGFALFAGAMVAPTVFHSEAIFSKELLSQFQEGLLMTKVFQKLAIFIDIAVALTAVYEGYRYKNFERDTISLLSGLTVIMSGLLFSHYYIPQIIEMQAGGESVTSSKIFQNTHFASELDIKLFSLALLILIVRNLYKSCK